MPVPVDEILRGESARTRPLSLGDLNRTSSGVDTPASRSRCRARATGDAPTQNSLSSFSISSCVDTDRPFVFSARRVSLQLERNYKDLVSLVDLAAGSLRA